MLRKKQVTGDIYIHTHLFFDINSSVSLENISFTVFGPNRKYVGNGSYLAILNAPKGTYTVNYDPVSGYDTPISETKVLNEGDSIKFSCNYLPKKRAGQRLDFRDGYVLIIKQIDSEKKEVLLELELDERKVAEAKVRVNESVAIHKKSYSFDTPIRIRYSGPYGISLWNISSNERGNYIVHLY